MKKIIKNGELTDLAYDDMKNFISLSRSLNEQVEDVTTDTEEVQTDEFQERKRKEEKAKEYTISGGKIIVHGTSEKELVLTGDEKAAFQETMDGFVEQVEDLADFNVLNIYKNNIEWSGNLIRFDLEYFYAVGETNGVYINGTMIKINDDFVEMLDKLSSFYDVFSTKWAGVLASRKTTETEEIQ
jgi:hypothetical protein|tara:strand:+ start:1291 stop:1845 length:555 start_codon:yes stop_codon:yes gene_type:complete